MATLDRMRAIQVRRAESAPLLAPDEQIRTALAQLDPSEYEYAGDRLMRADFSGCDATERHFDTLQALMTGAL